MSTRLVRPIIDTARTRVRCSGERGGSGNACGCGHDGSEQRALFFVRARRKRTAELCEQTIRGARDRGGLQAITSVCGGAPARSGHKNRAVAEIVCILKNLGNTTERLFALAASVSRAMRAHFQRMEVRHHASCGIGQSGRSGHVVDRKYSQGGDVCCGAGGGCARGAGADGMSGGYDGVQRVGASDDGANVVWRGRVSAAVRAVLRATALQQRSRIRESRWASPPCLTGRMVFRNLAACSVLRSIELERLICEAVRRSHRESSSWNVAVGDRVLAVCILDDELLRPGAMPIRRPMVQWRRHRFDAEHDSRLQHRAELAVWNERVDVHKRGTRCCAVRLFCAGSKQIGRGADS